MSTSITHATAPTGARVSAMQHPRVRRGMTLVEILFAVLIIFLVMALLIGGVRLATRGARDTAQRTAVLGLQQGMAQFREEMGFNPPLVMDVIRAIIPGPTPGITLGGQPISPIGPQGQLAPRVFSVSDHASFLRYLPPPADPDYRFSIYSLGYYLVGVLDQDRGGSGPDASVAIDGVAGPGFRTPRRDGTFETSGKIFQPFFSVGSGSTSVYPTDLSQGRIELRDTNGVAFRYYRWEPKENPLPNDSLRERLRVPYLVGDPEENMALRNARYAIMAAGPNGLFGNEAQLHPSHPQYLTWVQMGQRLGMSLSGTNPSPEERDALIRAAMQDNIVEVGR